MKSMRLRALLFQNNVLDEQAREQAAVQASAPPAPRPNNKTRRAQAAFNRKMKRRLAKDGTQAEVKILEDGGIHVHVGPEPKPE